MISGLWNWALHWGPHWPWSLLGILSLSFCPLPYLPLTLVLSQEKKKNQTTVNKWWTSNTSSILVQISFSHYITLVSYNNWFSVLNHICIPEINFTCSWYFILFNTLQNLVNSSISFRILIPTFINQISLRSFGLILSLSGSGDLLFLVPLN